MIKVEPLNLLYSVLLKVYENTVSGAPTSVDARQIKRAINILENLDQVEYLDCTHLVNIAKYSTQDIKVSYLVENYKEVKNPHIITGIDRAFISLFIGSNLSSKTKTLLLKWLLAVDILKFADKTFIYPLVYRMVYILLEENPTKFNQIEDMYMFYKGYRI